MVNLETPELRKAADAEYKSYGDGRMRQGELSAVRNSMQNLTASLNSQAERLRALADILAGESPAKPERDTVAAPVSGLVGELYALAESAHVLLQHQTNEIDRIAALIDK